MHQTLVNMKFVEATFFKNDKILKVQSDFGKYNNKTLDMSFSKNVKFFYVAVNCLLKKLNIPIPKVFNDIKGHYY